MFEARIGLRQVRAADQCLTLALLLQKLRADSQVPSPADACPPRDHSDPGRGASLAGLPLAELSSTADPKSCSFAEQQAPCEAGHSLTPKKIPIRMSNRTVFHKREEVSQLRDQLPHRTSQPKPASKSTTSKRTNAIRTSLIMSNIHNILKRIDSQLEDRRTESQVRVKLSNFVQPASKRSLDTRPAIQPGFPARPGTDCAAPPEARPKPSQQTDAAQLRTGILKLSRGSRQSSQTLDKENSGLPRSLKRADSGLLPDLGSSTHLAAHSAILHHTMSAKHRSSKTPLQEVNNMTHLFDSNASRQLVQKTPGASKKDCPQVLVKTKKYLIKSNSNYIEGFG